MDELIRERLEGEHPEAFDERAWYLTLAIEREVEIHEAEPGSPELIWVEVGDVDPLLAAFKAEFEPALNVLALRLEDAIGLAGLFDEVVLEDQLYLFREDKPPLSIPQLHGHAGSLSVKKSFGENTVTALQERADTLGAAWAASKGIERAIHWYLAALRARDPWNRFQWAFCALEVLTHKLARKHYSAVSAKLMFDASEGEPVVASRSLGVLMWPEDRLPLSAKFAVVALALSPHSAESDVANFATVKTARDDLAHGQITDAASLPDASALDLVRRYLHLATGS